MFTELLANDYSLVVSHNHIYGLGMPNKTTPRFYLLLPYLLKTKEKGEEISDRMFIIHLLKQ